MAHTYLLLVAVELQHQEQLMSEWGTVKCLDALALSEPSAWRKDLDSWKSQLSLADQVVMCFSTGTIWDNLVLDPL